MRIICICERKNFEAILLESNISHVIVIHVCIIKGSCLEECSFNVYDFEAKLYAMCAGVLLLNNRIGHRTNISYLQTKRRRSKDKYLARQLNSSSMRGSSTFTATKVSFGYFSESQLVCLANGGLNCTPIKELKMASGHARQPPPPRAERSNLKIKEL